MKNQGFKLSVAPMMDWTDRHCRYFHRLMSRRAVLYTEMVTADAVIHGVRKRLLGFSPAEHPIVLQLGGSDPAKLAEAARIGADRGYDAINLNCGCPSDRVQSGTFGACLMRDAAHVAGLVEAMKRATTIPVTVKCRVGVDDQDPHQVLPDFIAKVRDAGVDAVIVHARKAWLEGLSPKENRDVPPLDYDLVLAMKREFPDLWMGINGGIAALADAKTLLDQGMDEVMIGRAAYQTPADILLHADEVLFGDTSSSQSRGDVVRAMLPYIEKHLVQGGRLNQITRHMIGLFAGQPGARQWRRILSEGAHLDGAGPELVLQALSAVEQRQTQKATAA
ncbi:tRNA dihydrouridine(20/20a) synthase DusA [Ahrensia marina]|uniref:tRNA dihydrouridine(20/20a) synthase DusA n=1 Tax=Ahrensia marina TaxID=1514904 RepID=UPI0035CFBE80